YRCVTCSLPAWFNPGPPADAARLLSCAGSAFEPGREAGEELADDQLRGGLHHPGADPRQRAPDVRLARVLDRRVRPVLNQNQRPLARDLPGRALSLDQHLVAFGSVLLADLDSSVVGAPDGGDADLHRRLKFVGTNRFQSLATRQARAERFRIQQEIPNLLARRGKGVLTRQLHRTCLLTNPACR